jgi:hypothetical protein
MTGRAARIADGGADALERALQAICTRLPAGRALPPEHPAGPS